MTPKEKANELMIAFAYPAKDGIPITSKQASLEYVKSRMIFRNLIYKGKDIKYWQEVKKEIEAL